MERLSAIMEQVIAPDPSLGLKAQAHIDNLTKPPGSLGRLENLARDLCVMRGTLDLAQPRPAVAVFAADHGAALAGVSAFPREVTAQMVMNFVTGGAGINAIARQVGARVLVVDVGVDYDFPETAGLIRAKVARGTTDLLQGPAMSKDQALQAIEVGAKVAADLIADGVDLLIPGEMGIGNTTASSALAAAFTGLPPSEVTGRGTGLDSQGFKNKVAYITRALELHKPDTSDPLGVLAALGGLEIAAICGYALMAATHRIPIILDGLISTAGCLCAARICPEARHYFIAGHTSVEIGQQAMLQDLGLRPLLDLKLRLGEGTGAALALAVVRSAVAVYKEMATFESAGVSNQEE
ncbi:MAG: nicotinate-nucleotide--dimethylbenzimidazole phosphoribosyltransferase [Desulfarculaceae bacterium]